MRPNCRSSGVATDEAMVSGLAPGRPATTEMVGKSTCGSGDTGSSRKATAPASAMASVSSVVATGPVDEGRRDVHRLLRRHRRACAGWLGVRREKRRASRSKKR